MALPTSPASSWVQALDFPSELFATGSDDYELYEDDEGFVLTVELPGYSVEDVEVTWDDGTLNVAAEREDEARGRRRTYHRRFRFPKQVLDEDITASYENGVLEVRLPVAEAATARGTAIDIE